MFFTFYYQDIAIIVKKKRSPQNLGVSTERPLELFYESNWLLHFLELLTGPIKVANIFERDENTT